MSQKEYVEEKESVAQKLRRKIYIIESLNLRKRVPKKDSEMVEEIIKEIKLAVEEEG